MEYGQTGSFRSLKSPITMSQTSLVKQIPENVRSVPEFPPSFPEFRPRVPRKLGMARPRLGLVRWLLFLLDLLSLFFVSFFELLPLFLLPLLYFLSPRL